MSVTRFQGRSPRRSAAVMARVGAWVVGISVAALAGGVRADTVESVSGAVIEGKVTSRDDKFIVMDVQVRGKPVQRKFLVSQVRAVTVDGKREVL